ncbi:hypothetical protein [Taklimakanibacter deserti]|uniref:hypothetical protein n=1 Tax=Taklimakanibacter deserti TaxID=2267839 RepID=UPI0013C476FB
MVPDTELPPIRSISDGSFSALCRDHHIPESKRDLVRHALDDAAAFAEQIRQDRSQHRPRRQDAEKFDASSECFHQMAIWFSSFDTLYPIGHSIQVIESLAQQFLDSAAGKHLAKVLQRDFVRPIRRNRTNASRSEAPVDIAVLIAGNPGDVLSRLMLALSGMCAEVRDRLSDVGGPDRLAVVPYLTYQIAGIYYAALNKIPGTGWTGPFPRFLEAVFDGMGLNSYPSGRMLRDVVTSWRRSRDETYPE